MKKLIAFNLLFVFSATFAQAGWRDAIGGANRIVNDAVQIKERVSQSQSNNVVIATEESTVVTGSKSEVTDAKKEFASSVEPQKDEKKEKKTNTVVTPTNNTESNTNKRNEQQKIGNESSNDTKKVSENDSLKAKMPTGFLGWKFGAVFDSYFKPGTIKYPLKDNIAIVKILKPALGFGNYEDSELKKDSCIVIVNPVNHNVCGVVARRQCKSHDEAFYFLTTVMVDTFVKAYGMNKDNIHYNHRNKGWAYIFSKGFVIECGEVGYKTGIVEIKIINQNLFLEGQKIQKSVDPNTVTEGLE